MIMSDEIFGKIRARGLTIGRLAARIHMKPQTLSKKIKGTSRIYHDEITALSIELNLTSEEVITFFYPEVSKFDTSKPSKSA